MNDEEKDLFIKNELKKDNLISKKADDLFNEYLQDKSKLEAKNSKVVELNQRNKSNFGRTLLSAVASFMIIFLTANGYAATKGYNNIFFIIKNAFSQTEEKPIGKEEILSDRDITISYNMIKIANDVNLQVSRLIVSEEKVTLTTTFAVDGDAKNYPTRILITDITNGKNKRILADYKVVTKKTLYANQFTEIIDLYGFENNTNNIKMEVYSDSNCITELEIILDKKEINVVSVTEEKAEKISEVELKSFLSEISKINYYKDNNKLEGNTEEERRTEVLLQIVSEKFGNGVKEDAVSKYINELTGMTLNNSLINSNSTVKYNSQEDDNELENEINSLCLQIDDISFSNGVYTVKYIYCYPEKDKSNEIEQLEQFEATAKIRLNKQYDYSRFCLINSDNMQTIKLSTKNKINVGNIIIDNTISNTDSNILINETTNNTITNKVTNNTVVTNTITNNKTNNTIAIVNSNTIININDRADLISGMHFYVDKVEFAEDNSAIIYTRISESQEIAKNKRINAISVSYEDPSCGATSLENRVESDSDYFFRNIMLPKITKDVKNIEISLKCELGLIANLAINVQSHTLAVTYGNDLLNVDDVTKLETELKEVASRYILMNYYKDTENNDSQEAKNEMMLYTAFLLDEDGMFRNFGYKSTYTNIGESIIYSIIKGYTGIEFNPNTNFTHNFMTREENIAGVEASIKYIAGKKYNLEANIISVENFEKLGSFNYTITFTYSYNLNPNNKYRATINLKTYEYDTSNPIAKQFVLYKLTDTNIQSEKIN